MLNEDLSQFFSTAEFARNATLAGMPVRGIFDNDSAEAGLGVGMVGSRPVFTLATADVPPAPVGLQIVIDYTAYEITGHAPDGTGITVLQLEKTP